MDYKPYILAGSGNDTTRLYSTVLYFDKIYTKKLFCLRFNEKYKSNVYERNRKH